MPLPVKSLPFYLTKREYISILSKHPNKRIYIVAPALAIAIGLLLGLLVNSLIGLAIGFFFFVFVCGVLASRRKVFENITKHPSNQWAFTECRTVEFFDDRLVTGMSNGFLSHVPWSIISKAEVRDNALILAIGSSQTMIVPIRAIASQSDRSDIAQLLTTRGLFDLVKEHRLLEASAEE